jgi:hypothetical protein
VSNGAVTLGEAAEVAKLIEAYVRAYKVAELDDCVAQSRLGEVAHRSARQSIHPIGAKSQIYGAHSQELDVVFRHIGRHAFNHQPVAANIRPAASPRATPSDGPPLM